MVTGFIEGFIFRFRV